MEFPIPTATKSRASPFCCFLLVRSSEQEGGGPREGVSWREARPLPKEQEPLEAKCLAQMGWSSGGHASMSDLGRLSSSPAILSA